MKMKISTRWRHCTKIFKTNLKTHISPLLNRPQGCQGYQKNRKDLRITTMIHFAANIKPKLKKTQNITKNRHISTIFVDFEGVYAIYSILAEYQCKKGLRCGTLGPSRSFDTPGSGNIWFELEKSSKSQCVMFIFLAKSCIPIMES